MSLDRRRSFRRREAKRRRQLARSQIRRAETTLDEIRSRLDGTTPRLRARTVKGTHDGFPVRVEYLSTSGDFVSPAEQHRYRLTLTSRWTSQRFSLTRSRPLATERRIARLERKLSDLPASQRAIVVEMLTEIPGALTLTRSRVMSLLPPDVTADTLLERVHRLSEFQRRLVAASR